MTSKQPFQITSLLTLVSRLLSRLFSRNSSDKKSPTTQQTETGKSEPATNKYGLTADEIKRLEVMHAFEEGSVPTVYKDSEGYDTIGIGHLVDERKGGYLPIYAHSELQSKGYLSDSTISRLYEEDLNRTLNDLKLRLPWVFYLDPVRRDVLIDMCFQMGIGYPPRNGKPGKGLLGFVNTLRYIQNGNYEQAAKNMLVSKWATQTPNRAKRRAEEMRTGVYYNYQ